MPTPRNRRPIEPQPRAPHPHFDTLADLSSYWIEYQTDAALTDALASMRQAGPAPSTVAWFNRCHGACVAKTDRYTRPIENIEGMAHRIDDATSALVVASGDLVRMRDAEWRHHPPAPADAANILAIPASLTHATAAHLAPALRVALAYLPEDRRAADTRTAELAAESVVIACALARSALQPIKEERARWSIGAVGAADIAVFAYSNALGIACGLILEPGYGSMAPPRVREIAERSNEARVSAARERDQWSTDRTTIRLRAMPARALLNWVKGIGGSVGEALHSLLDRPSLMVGQITP